MSRNNGGRIDDEEERLPHNRKGPWYRRANVEPALLAIFFAFGLTWPLTSIFLFYARCIEIYSHEAPPSSSLWPLVSVFYCQYLSSKRSLGQHVCPRATDFVKCERFLLDDLAT